MEINGFIVEKYNQYDLPEGKKYHTCPLCSESRKKKTQKCLTIFWDSYMAKCSHCGENIQINTYKKKKQDKYKVPEWSNNTELSDKAVKWFESRKISQFITRLMKIGEGIMDMPNKSGWAKMNTIQFPYFRNGEAVNIKYRSGNKGFRLVKDAEKIPYNIDNAVGQDKIYLVEGELDVLAAMECGIHNVVSPPNGFPEKGNINLDWINNDIEPFAKAEKLILAFDNDKNGDNGKSEFIRRFGGHKCHTVDLKDCKDSNEYLIKYGTEELKKALENHIEIPLENISTYNDYKEKVRDFFLNGMPKGITTGYFGNMDKNFSTYSSQIILMTGIPGSGKSEVIDQMVIGYALSHGYKTAFASIENKPNEMHQQKIIRKLNGSAPKDKTGFNLAFEACEKFSDDHFYMIDIDDGYDLDKVLLKAEELVFRKGIKVLVIDPFNKVRYKGAVESVTGNRTNDYTSVYLHKLDQFANKYDLIMILAAHPVKMPKDINGKRAVPDFYDVKGGGEFYDMCHHGLVVDRDYERGIVLIRNLKVKFAHLGENNAESWFKYNINNGRLSDIEGDVSDNNYNIIWDNTNWVAKSAKSEQKEINIFNDYGIEDDDFRGEAPF